MKRIASLIFSITILVSLTACSSNKSEIMQSSSSVNITENTEEHITEKNTDKSNTDFDDATVGEVILNDFLERIKAEPNISAEKLAESILANDIIEFEGAVTPVSEGLLTGFGNTEIKGFKEGVMFSPMIGSIPFVGYIFVLNSEDDAEEFMRNLKDNADLRWNICTEADQMIIDYSGNTILFLMCPNSFESE